jgi:hypothetical protein
MRLQDIIKREAPSAYIFESDGTVHRQQSLDDGDDGDGGEVSLAGKESDSVTATALI